MAQHVCELASEPLLDLLRGAPLAPGLASIYRALATHEKTSSYPDAAAQANAEFAERHADAATAGIVRPRPAGVLEPVNAELRDRIQRSPRERER